MSGKLKSWYQSQRSIVRLFLFFFFNLLLWLLAEWGFDLLLLETRDRTFGRRLLGAAIMAIGWTLFMDWKTAKAVFRKKRVT